MQTKSTHKLLHEYADIYENAIKAGSDATWHIPILEAFPLMQKLTQALRQIENLTHPDEDHADKDHMEMVERVNLMAQEALR